MSAPLPSLSFVSMSFCGSTSPPHQPPKADRTVTFCGSPTPSRIEGSKSQFDLHVRVALRNRGWAGTVVQLPEWVTQVSLALEGLELAASLAPQKHLYAQLLTELWVDSFEIDEDPESIDVWNPSQNAFAERTRLGVYDSPLALTTTTGSVRFANLDRDRS